MCAKQEGRAGTFRAAAVLKACGVGDTPPMPQIEPRTVAGLRRCWKGFVIEMGRADIVTAVQRGLARDPAPFKKIEKAARGAIPMVLRRRI